MKGVHEKVLILSNDQDQGDPYEGGSSGLLRFVDEASDIAASDEYPRAPSLQAALRSGYF